jgi:hypothetical protein
MVTDTDCKLNSFATRSFRDVADGDYIIARQAFRQRLMQQALWSGLQAIEKYLKAILLYNRVPSHGLNHNIVEALARVRKQVKFEVKLTPAAEDFIRYLDNYGKYRYYEISYYTMGREMTLLDHTVWYLRRYCQVLDYTLPDATGKEKNMLDIELRVIDGSVKKPFQQFRISNGDLEQIIDKPDHPARPALIWQNGFFGKSRRKKLRIPSGMQAGNAPLLLHPEILDVVVKYVFIPDEAKKAYRALAAEKKTKKP